MSVRNFEEYRAEVLERLGATAEDIRKESSWRAKVLEALGAEYTDEDTRNFERYRLKVLENLSGGGGSSWQTVFEGSVTTVEVSGGIAPVGTIEGVFEISADSIKVTFNGVEYTCPKLSDGSYGAPYDEGTDSFDFSEYPFIIYNDTISTETAGTYTLKIEEPQSGGSSDFSTAEVSIVVNESASSKPFVIRGFMCMEADNDYPAELSYTEFYNTENCIVPLYKGQSTWAIEIDGDNPVNVSCTGNAEFDTSLITITGDCTITIS